MTISPTPSPTGTGPGRTGWFSPGSRRAGLLLAAVQCGLLLAIGGQMLLERALRPRGWARVEPVDPNLPIRGRYIRLQLSAPAPSLDEDSHGPIRLVVRGDRVEAIAASDDPRGASTALTAWLRSEAGGTLAVLDQRLAFFLPPDVPDPSARAARGAERLWVEVTLPSEGLPRPIRLGTDPDGSGAITPLKLR
ncbi:MAG: hypothetical protein VKO65_04745 [Cyanobacteriota bacterium]|nr:hypothetical protein [Cyanobacteriota bacterium]